MNIFLLFRSWSQPHTRKNKIWGKTNLLIVLVDGGNADSEIVEILLAENSVSSAADEPAQDVDGFRRVNVLTLGRNQQSKKFAELLKKYAVFSDYENSSIYKVNCTIYFIKGFSEMFVLKMYGTNAMLAVGILGFEDLSYTYELKEDNLKVNSDKISHCVTQKQILFDRCRNNYE